MDNDQLKLDRHNANKGTDRGKELLEQSIKELGAGRSILVDKDGNVIAGNKTLAAARKAGLKVRVVPTDRDELVVVQRQDLNLDDAAGEARRLAYLDNRVAEIDLEWDVEVLAADAQAGLDMVGMGFLERELEKILKESELEILREEDPGAEIDKAEELREKWNVESGQVWQLGEHRLLCGDSRDANVVNRLMRDEYARCMWTDPPYGVEYVGKTKDALKIENDQAESLPALLQSVFAAADGVLMDGAPIYVAHPAGPLGLVFGNAILEVGWHLHATLIWVKDSMVLGHGDYHYQHEPVYYGWKGKDRFWYGGRSQKSVMEIARPKRSELHPTIKPVEWVEAHLINSSLPGDVVYDPFVGSGTTLITCERLRRRCRAMDIDPRFVAVTIERWQLLTGTIPVLTS